MKTVGLLFILIGCVISYFVFTQFIPYAQSLIPERPDKPLYDLGLLLGLGYFVGVRFPVKFVMQGLLLFKTS